MNLPDWLVFAFCHLWWVLGAVAVCATLSLWLLARFAPRSTLVTILVVALVGVGVSLLLGGCASKPVQATIPSIVEVPVKELVPMEPWTWARIAVPERADGKLFSILGNEEARGTRLRYANCRLELIEKLQHKQPAGKHDCDYLLLAPAIEGSVP
jgi:hypothetical protein